MGLAHSDLSYNNVLVDPVERSACMIDLDGLVVPGLYPAEVIGTAEFIAPEVLSTKHLKKDDPNRVLPSRLTDLHALPVLIYMLLLHRHPLKGSKVHGHVACAGFLFPFPTDGMETGKPPPDGLSQPVPF